LFLNLDVANGKGRSAMRNFPFAPLFVLAEFGADIMNTVYYNLEYNAMEYYNPNI